MIEGVIITPLKIIDVIGGDVLHAMKSSDSGYSGFGEAYFSKVDSGAIKGWKRHQVMTLNLIVPVGSIRFVIYDDRPQSVTEGMFQEIELSQQNYNRLTIPSLTWVAFQGVDANTSILLNIASIPHEPSESENKELKEITFDWRMAI